MSLRQSFGRQAGRMAEYCQHHEWTFSVYFTDQFVRQSWTNDLFKWEVPYSDVHEINWNNQCSWAIVVSLWVKNCERNLTVWAGTRPMNSIPLCLLQRCAPWSSLLMSVSKTFPQSLCVCQSFIWAKSVRQWFLVSPRRMWITCSHKMGDKRLSIQDDMCTKFKSTQAENS